MKNKGLWLVLSGAVLLAGCSGSNMMYDPFPEYTPGGYPAHTGTQAKHHHHQHQAKKHHPQGKPAERGTPATTSGYPAQTGTQAATGTHATMGTQATPVKKPVKAEDTTPMINQEPVTVNTGTQSGGY